MTIAYDDPVGRLLDRIPALKSPNISATSNVYAFLHRRIEKLRLKINTISPYAPLEREEAFGVNSNFPLGLCKWLDQFPEKQRLGFLLPVLSTEFLTQPEMKILLSIAIRRLEEQVAENEARLKTVFRLPWREKIRVYPVSQFGERDDFIRMLGLSGTRDRDTHPSRTTIEDVVYDAFSELRSLAEYGSDFQYYDRTASKVEQLLRSFLNAHIVLIEDGSFSGTRIVNTASKFLSLLNVLFGKYGKRLESKGHSVPYVYLLVLVGTSNAHDAILKIREYEKLTPLNKNFFPIFGFLFDEKTDSFRRSLPDSLGELQSLLGEHDLHYELTKSIEFFKENYFHGYLAETRISEATGRNLEEIKWGFGDKGWSVVTHKNCPNNSLPLLWYPHVGSTSQAIRALFPRDESHTTHADKADMFKDNLPMAERDQKGFLKTYISRCYDSL